MGLGVALPAEVAVTVASRWTVAALLCAAAVIILALWAMNHEHRALVSALAGREAAELALKHQTVEAQESRKALQASEADLLAKNAVLAAAVESAKAAAPGAQPVSASEFQTAPEKVISVLTGPPKGSPNAVTGPATACALSTVESAWFKVDLIELQTKDQNTLVAGTAELWAQGADLVDRRVLGPSRFQSAVSSSAALAPPAAPRWGAEVLGACAARGCGLGGGVLFPPVSLLGLRIEARAGVLAGPEATALGAVGLRF